MKNKSEFTSTIIACVAMILCVAVAGVTFAQSVGKIEESNLSAQKLFEEAKGESAATDTDTFYTDDGFTQPNTDLPQADTESTVPSENESADTSTDTPEKPADKTEADSGEMTSVDEIVTFFNQSINNVKPTATKVVKNYEKRKFHEDKTEIPEAIESVAASMMSSMMGDDTEPIVYATKEEIRANFIVPEQDYSSKLKSDWVKEASCKDNGNEYVIYIKLKDHKNPTAGNGVGAVCDVIETHEVANKVSFVEEFSTMYYNCEITATINKATGNVTHIRYSTPLLLNMTVNLFGTHTGVIAFTFEKDYTITY